MVACYAFAPELRTYVTSYFSVENCPVHTECRRSPGNFILGRLTAWTGRVEKTAVGTDRAHHG